MLKFRYICTVFAALLILAGCNAPSADIPGVSSAAVEEDGTVEEAGNPIDEAFDPVFQSAATTAEMSIAAGDYLSAWKMEWEHVLSLLIAGLPYAEDRETMARYTSSFAAFSEQAAEVEWLEWTGVTGEPSARPEGSGAPGAAMLREAELYRSEALHLIAEYEDMNASGDYYAYQYQDSAEPADRP